MAGYTKKQLQEVKVRLLATQDEIEVLLGRTRREARPVDLDLPIGRLSRADAIQMQNMAQVNKRQLDIQLQQIKGALEAIDHGNYGSCRNCKGTINMERLDAKPESPFCISCQEMFENER